MARQKHRERPPSVEDILNAWYSRLPTEKGHCMACSRTENIERAHLEPLRNGGANVPENYHLLCRHCHRKTEFWPKEAYWSWLQAMRQFR